MAATTCAKPAFSSSFLCTQLHTSSCPTVSKQISPPPSTPLIKQRNRFALSAAARDLPSTDSDNAVNAEHSLRRWRTLPSVAAVSIAAGLSAVGRAGAIDENDAVRAYDAFVNGASSVSESVASDGGDALAGVTAALGDNAAVIGAVAVFAVGVPSLALGISRLFNKGYAGDVSAEEALRLLEEDATSVLVDIRPNEEISEFGSPKVTGKKAARIQWQTGSDEDLFPDPAFATKVEAKSKSKDSPIYIIDSTGSTSVEAAKSLTQAGFEKVFNIKGGTEAWLASELPWLKPVNFTLDLGTLKQAIDTTVKENPNVVPATLGIAAATAGSFLLFSEAEAALQLLGSAAVAQVLIKKLLFAEDRKRTIGQLKSFLDTKVAPQELVDEIKEIGSALLPGETASATTTSEASSEVGTSKASTEAAKTTGSETTSESDGSAASSEGANGARSAATEISELPPSPTPLSPYATYPELKPPSSPTPTKP